MNQSLEDRIVRRMRGNLDTAGIQISDEDLDGMRQKGFLANVVAFEELISDVPVDLVPDYLGSWGDVPSTTGQSPAASLPQNDGPIFGAPDGQLEAEPERYASITSISGMLRRGDVSSKELTERTLSRIRARDPELNAFQVILDDYARSAAERADRERADGVDRGPLHGVPIAIKDLLAMKGTVTTAGSKVLGDWKTEFNADSVDRLEEAGAVIVGKTRLSEFAYSPGSNNAHYGATHNPWNLDYDTGGSSSGSGAAVADGLVYGALGSDTGGSIRMPAALCGIVGLKPTHGRVSLHGGVTLSWSLDHLGPMTRTVGDSALMLQVLAGYDERDLRTRTLAPDDYVAASGAGVRGKRVGVVQQDGSGGPLASDDALAAWNRGLVMLESAGAELVEINMPDLQALRVLNSSIVAMEAAAFHQPMLAARLSDFGEFMRQRILAAYGFGPMSLVRAQQARASIRNRCNSLFDEVDLISTPAMPSEAPLLGDPGRNTWFTGPFNSLGWPAIVVPVSVNEKNLPLSMQLVAAPWQESTVFAAAGAFEGVRGTIAGPDPANV